MLALAPATLIITILVVVLIHALNPACGACCVKFTYDTMGCRSSGLLTIPIALFGLAATVIILFGALGLLGGNRSREVEMT